MKTFYFFIIVECLFTFIYIHFAISNVLLAFAELDSVDNVVLINCFTGLILFVSDVIRKHNIWAWSSQYALLATRSQAFSFQVISTEVISDRLSPHWLIRFPKGHQFTLHSSELPLHCLKLILKQLDSWQLVFDSWNLVLDIRQLFFTNLSIFIGDWSWERRYLFLSSFFFWLIDLFGRRKSLHVTFWR